MTTVCHKCNALLMLVPSGAVCSREPACGGIISFYDRKGIEAAWKQRRLDALFASVPKAIQVDGSMASYTIEGQAGEFVLESVVNFGFIESKNYDESKLQAHGMTLAAREVRKGKSELCWFAPKHREPVVDLWDVPTKQPATAPPARDPNLSREAIPRVSKQALQVLEQLRSGPKTNRQLLEVAIRYGSRLHDLRKAGYDIQIVSKDEASGLVTYKLVGGPSE